MRFIVISFLKRLEACNIKYSMEYDDEKDTYTIYIREIPAELDSLLITVSYKEEVGVRQVFDKYNRVIKSTPIIEKVNVCIPEIDNNGENRIRIVVSKNDYAKKLNMVDAVIRKYANKHGMKSFI